MAFHVGCPITSRRICFCALGFPPQLQTQEARNAFLDEVSRVGDFLKDPWLLKATGESTVQVLVPKIVAPPPPPVAVVVDGGGGDGEEMLSAQTKRAALQKRAAEASLVAEDYARRFESGDLPDATEDHPGEDLAQSNVKIMCRLCYAGENEGSERARKMLPCRSCNKKYHRSCLKSWAQNRDLFHWSSWTCPSCRTCEVCRRTGDHTKFMFCKRCDGAHHCYCQQPPHKNVSSGPYLCPKHTRCHSCNSSVPGNGHSTRWFLSYSYCDACGRLFSKGNYCPVCLKVYRDSESTPMVCCDICQRWVHCQCDGISDEKYLQFQADGNLQYKCATCRGECYQVKNQEDAVQELWRRRDEADHDLILSLRVAAGLPTQEEIFSISPYSDDEEAGPVLLKNENNNSLKFSVKGLVEKSPKKNKESAKRSSNKKYPKKVYQPSMVSKSGTYQSFEGHVDHSSVAYGGNDDQNDNLRFHKDEGPFSLPIAGSMGEGKCSVNQAGILKRKFVDDVNVGAATMKSRPVHIKNSKPGNTPTGDNMMKDDIKPKSTNSKGPKLVIHLGGRNRNATGSPKSDTFGHQKEQEFSTFNGSDHQDHLGNRQMLNRHSRSADGDKIDLGDSLKSSMFRGKEPNLLKIRKVLAGVADMSPKIGGKRSAVGYVSPPMNSQSSLGKRYAEENSSVKETIAEVPPLKSDRVYSRKNTDGKTESATNGNNNDDTTPAPSGSLSSRDGRPFLKLKFKHRFAENQTSWAPQGEDDKSSVKGQRSKRKRPSPNMEKTSSKDGGDASSWREEDAMSEIMDANWILQKLGKDAIGKRVEIHQSSDNTWHKGRVDDLTEGTSMVSVALDDGRARTLDLGKQAIRFISQKQKR